MSTYFRWIARGPDLTQAQVKVLQVSASPRTAYWIFDMSGLWKPSASISDDRVLVAITFNDWGQKIITDQSKWIRFPDETGSESDSLVYEGTKTRRLNGYRRPCVSRWNSSFLRSPRRRVTSLGASVRPLLRIASGSATGEVDSQSVSSAV